MYRPKICPICGTEFIPQSAKQKYCKREITLKCKVCGADYIGYCQPENKTVCDNSECKKKAASAGCKNTEQKTKICRTCGKLFVPKFAKQLDCNEQTLATCEICGKPFYRKCNKYITTSTCSEECKKELARRGHEQFYSTVTRTCELCGKLFTPTTNTQKYCTDQHYRICEICGKSFPFDHRKLKADWPRTCSHECLIKLHAKNNGMQTEAARNKSRAARYSGTEAQFNQYQLFLNSPESYLSSLSSKKTIYQLSQLFGIHTTTMGQYINKLDLQPFISYEMSNMENAVIDFIYTLGVDIVRHDRKTIRPKELDIWIPEYRVGIECNPTSSHNSSKSMYDRSEPLEYTYHQTKTDMCEAQGVRLIHLFGYEWKHKRLIMESILRNALGKNARRIYARKCELREVSYSDSKEFLTSNHRQGFANSSVRLGLYYQDELVSLMTFGKIRRTIGTNKDVDGWELVRFCNTLNTSVVGGASKLFKHFVDTYHPENVISFSDRAHTSGKLYETLGFTEKRRSSPGYVWVDELTDIAYNRVNAQKHNLKKFLNDDTVDLSETETQIMEEHGFVKVYDSGVITWQWNNQIK